MATTIPTRGSHQDRQRRSQRSATPGRGLYAALLGGAASAVALVAALTAWAARLGGGACLLVLAPFAVVWLVPVGGLVWLRTATDVDEPA